MSKIEYIISQQKEIDVLDIYQYQNISLYDNFANSENGKKVIRACQSLGYLIPFENKNDKLSFIIPSTWKHKGTYDDCLILIVKRILTFYHKKRTIRIQGTPFWSAEAERILVQYVDIDCSDLTAKEKGLLTKILKTENKRKRMYGKS